MDLQPDKSVWATLGGNSLQGQGAFASPWRDLSSRYTPRTMRDALWLCEFLYLNYGIYRSASEKVVDYFLTKPIFKGQDDSERDKFDKLMRTEFGVIQRLREIGYDLQCFQGDTLVPTRSGTFKIKDLVGQRVDVISRGGMYRPADFKSFGRQELLEVEFSDGSTILATPEHQWVAKNCSGREVKVSTTDLGRGYRIERTVAPRPEKNEEFYEGVRHGFVFKRIHGLPGHFKELPSNESSASYWYGFVCGFLAADGTVDTYGCSMMTHISKKTLEAIKAQLPRIGMVAGPIRAQRRTVDLSKVNGNPESIYDSTIHFMTLLKRFMLPQDILLSSHLEKFNENARSGGYGRFIGVRGVKKTGIVEEVFCCTEMETHTFVVGNGILTGNCYGNSFSSIHLPFTRVLRCQRCGSDRNMVGKNREIVPFHFDSTTFTFHLRCDNKKCKQITRHMVHDYAKRDAKLIKLVRWDPKKIEIELNELTQDARYWLDIDPQIQAKVRRGDPFTLATLPWSFIVAIKKRQKYLFDNDWFLHLREASLAGLHMGGWGIPSVLSAFKNFFRLQILYRYDETLKMDYIVPLRILAPASTQVPTGGNEFLQIGMKNFVEAGQAAVRRHRVDGADWSFFPFPVTYQAIGGEGAQLDQSTRDTIQSEEDRLLNTRKIAPELYRGNLTLQNAPVGLRLFESGHTPLIAGLNRAIQFMSNAVGRYMDSGDHEAELESVKITDNLDDKAWRLQAAMTGAISKETGFGPLGIDSKEEERRVIQEQIRQQKEQAKAQQDAQMEAMSLDTQQSQSEGQNPGSGMTPGDVEAQGEETAKQLLDPTLPETNRRQQLAALRTSNPTLHAVVIKKMEELRGRAGTAGQAAGLQSMGIGGGQQKAGDFERLHKLAQVRWAAEAFFPPARHPHRLGLTPDQDKLALTLSMKEGSIPVMLKQSDLDERPFDLMVTIQDLLLKSGFSFE